VSAELVGPRFERFSVRVERRRHAAPEILGVVPLPPDQRGADDLAVLLDQAAVRLAVKRGLRDAGHEQRVCDAREHGEKGDGDERGAELFQHGFT